MEDDDFLKQLQAELDREMEAMNLAPREDIDHLSATDMNHILYFTFDKISPIGFRHTIKAEILEQVPFLKLSYLFLEILRDRGGVKLTKMGNLPRNLCFELYETGILKEDFIESGMVKFNKEGDTVSLQNVRMISLFGGLTKKRKNVISLTSRGEKLLHSDSKQKLLEILFQTNCQKLNLGYHDRYPQNVGIQKTFGYTLYLLLRYGKEKRKVDFYSDKNLTAFPMILHHFENIWRSKEDQYKSCYEIRIIERFLNYYNFVEYENKRSPLSSKEPIEVNTTAVFDEVFELKIDRFRFKKSTNLA